MPADGEFLFSPIIVKNVQTEYQRLRGNSCLGPAFINCLFSGAFSWAGSYVYFHNANKSLKIAGAVGSTVMCVTGIVCTLERFQKSR